jgi:hypothetical protein
MTKNPHACLAFALAMAAKTGLGVTIVRIDQSCASSSRLSDLNLPEQMIEALGADDLAFITHSEHQAAKETFRRVVWSFPRSGETTLGLEVIQALPGGSWHVCTQPNGGPRDIQWGPNVEAT